MALKQTNRKARQNLETGLGTNTALNGGRFFHKNGQPNMHIRGMRLMERLNIYHSLLTMPQWKFLVVVVIFFLSVNLLFAGVYIWIGLDHLSGMVANTWSEKFGEAYFFSAQTFTTVGYGRINPVGIAASFVASLEALTGLMSFAVVTGLMYGRFARPRAFIRFSEKALFAPFQGGLAIMFRMVPFTRNYLVNVEVRTTLAIQELEDGVAKNRFYSLPLQLSRANTLTANWTLVHVINEESPLYGLTHQDLLASKAEMLVFVEGFDESFSNTVISKTSYNAEDFVYGAKFRAMYHPNETQTATVLELDLLNAYDELPLPDNCSYQKA
ncbi:ion channel [Flavihumibacter petaseus]|uniref:Putative potassium channel n=1 Tax=Flavihumibacter petaseus NBRC 106054 TaxID=1220578 RepID=A0A0E9MYA7_9BACT|nr:ion channel [Flavihumibacter petaseus]GAO42483.1 putative potassium channel [Flavihumibacter petaseus NBRC 106054]